MKLPKSIAYGILFLMLFGIVGSIRAQNLPLNNSNKINIKLKWLHQFQFAGFYAAQLQGYYTEEGLDVTLIESSSISNSIEYVLTKENAYGVSSSELIESKANGFPVVLIASIFQHSPYVIISLKEKGIVSPKDLLNKKLMISNEQGSIQIKAMLQSANVELSKIKILEHTWNNKDIVNGYADAMSGYISVETYQLYKEGNQLNIIRPIDYGVDFYGDMLFTDIEEVKQHPERVLAVKRATLKGWEYAMTHIDEVAEYILSLPGVKERGITKENLVYEALMMQKLVKTDLVEIGHINKSRINNMIKLYKDFDVIDEFSDFTEFIYEEKTEESISLFYYRFLWIATILAAVIFAGIFIWNRQLRKKVNDQVSKLESEYKSRVIAEKIARESEERLELALSAARLGIWDSDLITGKVYRNEIWSDMLGYKPHEIESNYEGWRKLVHPEDFEMIDRSLKQHHDGDSLYNNYEHRLYTKNGEWKWILSLSKIVAKDAYGKATRLIGIHIDIDEIKSKELQLQALSDELIHSNRELEKFAYITSHNLRAPVVNIISLIELLDIDAIGDANNKLIIEKVQLSVLRLENTLNDLIEVVSAKKQALSQKTNIQISEVCQQVLSNLESQLTKVDADIILNFEGKNEILYVRGILESVLQNLLTNSIKYRNVEKKLKIEISTHSDNEYTYIYVRDNGVGFDSDVLGQKIFRLYERIHHHIEGKGLGLYLIKTQIESLNGRIDVYSKPMQGALFTVALKN
jgi:PAS domain S-box-containing protein